MIVSHVVAMSENRVIGRDGGLPWHIPADLKRFKAVTMGKMLLMGRKTYASIGRPLPGRLNIVVTRSPEGVEFPGGVVVCDSIENALNYAKKMAPQWQNELMIVGGGDIYLQTMDQIDRIYLSHVHSEVSGDTFYPELPPGFELLEKEKCAGPPDFSWCLYQKKRVN